MALTDRPTISQRQTAAYAQYLSAKAQCSHVQQGERHLDTVDQFDDLRRELAKALADNVHLADLLEAAHTDLERAAQQQAKTAAELDAARERLRLLGANATDLQRRRTTGVATA